MKKILIAVALFVLSASQLSAMDKSLPCRLRDLCRQAREKNGGEEVYHCQQLMRYFYCLRSHSSTNAGRELFCKELKCDHIPDRWDMAYHINGLAKEMKLDGLRCVGLMDYVMKKACCEKTSENAELCEGYRG